MEGGGRASNLSFSSMQKKVEVKKIFLKHAFWTVSIFPTFPYLEWLFVEKQQVEINTVIYDTMFFSLHLFFSVQIITRKRSRGDQ